LSDPAAREKLIISYSPFIKTAVCALRAKHKSNFDPEDLFQEGAVGLLEAVNDRNLLARFPHYAKRRIKKAIELAIIRERTFRDGHARLAADFEKYRKKRVELFIKLGRAPTVAEMARDIGFKKQKVGRLE
jgi:DNA-directed RNA polymerase specialized sigma subunit